MTLQHWMSIQQPVTLSLVFQYMIPPSPIPAPRARAQQRPEINRSTVTIHSIPFYFPPSRLPCQMTSCVHFRSRPPTVSPTLRSALDAQPILGGPPVGAIVPSSTLCFPRIEKRWVARVAKADVAGLGKSFGELAVARSRSRQPLSVASHFETVTP